MASLGDDGAQPPDSTLVQLILFSELGRAFRHPESEQKSEPISVISSRV
jgi:hypothetical protein